MKYMDTHIDKMYKTRDSKAPLLSQTLTRGFSFSNASSGNELPALTRTRFSIPNTSMGTSKMLKSQQIE